MGWSLRREIRSILAHCSKLAHPRFVALVALVALAVFLSVALFGCARVRPWEREHLADRAMQFEMAPIADGQTDTILEITEGGTFGSAGPGASGAGCGCH